MVINFIGQEWKDMRSTLSPAFTSSKIKLMVPLMEEVGEQMIRALKTKIETADGNLTKEKHVEVLHLLQFLKSVHFNFIIVTIKFSFQPPLLLRSSDYFTHNRSTTLLECYIICLCFSVRFWYFTSWAALIFS